MAKGEIMLSKRTALLGGLLACLWCAVSSAQGTTGSITAFGLTHTPLGSATLNQTADGVVVGNLGSSGQDGVSIDLSGVQVPGQNFSLDASLGDLGPLPSGSYIQSTAMATTSGGTNQLVSTIRGTQDSPNTFSVTADFTPVSNGQPLTIDYFSGGPNGNLVYTEQYAGTTPQMICPFPIKSIYTDRNGPWWDISQWTAGVDWNNGTALYDRRRRGVAR